jgi:hypothetical protein
MKEVWTSDLSRAVLSVLLIAFVWNKTGNAIGSGGVDLLTPNLGVRREWVFVTTLRPLYPRYPFYGRLIGPQDRSGRYRKSLPQLLSNPGPSSAWHFAIPTTLSPVVDSFKNEYAPWTRSWYRNDGKVAHGFLCTSMTLRKPDVSTGLNLVRCSLQHIRGVII